MVRGYGDHAMNTKAINCSINLTREGRVYHSPLALLQLSFTSFPDFLPP